ncbi:MAG TPA: right-handed parallel beta-helix repeat-containing protein, partial [Chitinophagales bacterium]|nr:right-handed parallel beta-helix repeat-containing protein [Chitinophagales bacterium]
MNRFFYIVFLIFLVHNVLGKTIVVGKGQPYTKIKTAVHVASPGDSIIVLKGVYKEGNIVIDKPLSLVGKNLPILDGQKKYEVLSVKSNNVTVDGFVIQRSSVATLDDPGGIKVYNSNYVVIQNCILEDNFFGIYIQYGKHCIIRNNKIKAYGIEEQQIGNGIHCWKSDSLLIIGNKVDGHRDGIYFEFVTGSTIWRNIANNNIRYGLHFMFSNDDAYICNVFKNNGA